MQIAYALKNNVTYIGGVENEAKQENPAVYHSDDYDFRHHNCRAECCGELHL